VNIFALDKDPVKAAEYMCDKHIVDVAINQGEHVLLLGMIDNISELVAVSTWDGNVLWPVNLNDFGEIEEI
jgi:hypothetical protein